MPTTHGLTAGDPHDERVAIVALLRAGAIPKAHMGAMIEHLGSAVELLGNSYALTADAQQSLPLESLYPSSDIERAAKEVATWEHLPYLVFTVLEAGYPERLRAIYNRPPLLFVQGNAEVLDDELTIAVVGTRKASSKGLERARALVRAFADKQITIVSGLATGIDTMAHTTALECEARTFAVVGTGLNTVYPTENRALAARIVEGGGAIVSQFLPSQHGNRATFPARNITMSGLSLGTIVVEASDTSGARMQARVALEHGRRVFLLKSLVVDHEWAQQMVHVGVQGHKASVLADPADVTDRIWSPSDAEVLAWSSSG